ncbi:MAG: deoxyribodipyrimidine photo-lyase [Pseudomonadota bacterium]
MSSPAPTILWLRRDLRLSDNPGWHKALEGGGSVVPVFILDPVLEQSLGIAPKWRLEQSLSALQGDLAARGSRLILRRGPAADVLAELVAETGAARLVWSRQYEAAAIARDKAIKARFQTQGLTVDSVNSSLLFEPWTVATKTGGFFRVYTPFWKNVRDREVGEPLPAPTSLSPLDVWPASDQISDWQLRVGMHSGAETVARYARVGEAAAGVRLKDFLEQAISRYRSERDFPDRHATSGLSENLTYGEISPRQMYAAALFAEQTLGAQGIEAEHFRKEIVWREFAYHLLFHTPEIATGNWRSEWDAFPWRDDNEDAERWRRGMTGIEMVDAAMREMYVTGTMHNRTRMLAASFLTKHLMTHWKVGDAWFRDCLIDWDPASNAMGWQWAAGSGPDASPYFRIFNPDTQAEKFDPRRAYRDRFIAEGRSNPHEDAMSYFASVPRTWELSPDDPYPSPIIGLGEGRARALQAYENRARA